MHFEMGVVPSTVPPPGRRQTCKQVNSTSVSILERRRGHRRDWTQITHRPCELILNLNSRCTSSRGSHTSTLTHTSLPTLVSSVPSKLIRKVLLDIPCLLLVPVRLEQLRGEEGVDIEDLQILCLLDISVRGCEKEGDGRTRSSNSEILIVMDAGDSLCLRVW